MPNPRLPAHDDDHCRKEGRAIVRSRGGLAAAMQWVRRRVPDGERLDRGSPRSIASPADADHGSFRTEAISSAPLGSSPDIGVARLPIRTPADVQAAEGTPSPAARDITSVCSEGRSVPRALRDDIHRDADADAHVRHERQAQFTLDSIGDAVVCTDVAGRVTYMNAVAEALTGWPRAEAVGQPLDDVFRIVDASTRAAVENPMVRATVEGRSVGLAPNSVLVSRAGTESAVKDSASPIRDGSGAITGAVMVFRDVSVTRAHAQRMEHLIQHDSLTEVANRILLNDRLTQAVALARREQRQVALLFVDMDHFKRINDTLGHDIGDRLLQSVAKRLLRCVRTSDTVSRIGGDEFVILLPEVVQAEDAALAAETILRAFDIPHRIDHHELQVSLSIGIATFPDDGAEADALLARADLAMYRAKATGRNNFKFFTEDMVPGADEQRMLEHRVVHAIKRHDLVLHYQPTFCLATRVITGVEALLRWRHPRRGFVLPRDFIALAEKRGAIVAIGRWVLHDACRQGQAWQRGCLPPMRIAVNVSAAELRAQGFVADVRDVLRATGLPAEYLELEVTEAVLLQNSRATGYVMRALKDIGVRLALDNFGTGLASIGHLRQTAVDVIKIDRSLVRNVATDRDSASVVGAVISVADSLHMQVVAEGVETAEQLMFLQEQSCAEAQGFYFSRPMAVDDVTALLWRTQTERIQQHT